jgi:hypothetical protein
VTRQSARRLRVYSESRVAVAVSQGQFRDPERGNWKLVPED